MSITKTDTDQPTYHYWEFASSVTEAISFTKPSEITFNLDVKGVATPNIDKPSRVIKTYTNLDGIDIVGDTLTLTVNPSIYEKYFNKIVYITLDFLKPGYRTLIIKMKIIKSSLNDAN